MPEFIDYIPTPLAWNQFVMMGILGLLLLALAFGLIKKTRPEEAEEEMEPELSVEDLLVSTQMEEIIEEENKSLEPIGYNEKSEAMQKLDSFIDEKPEAAASLLRHWLNEAEF
jgi:flagellar M-ring protein FliF